jgi:hypothetical protein
MSLARRLVSAAVAAVLAAGCTKYHPQPLSPETSAAAFGRRTLADTALTLFLAAWDSTRSTSWDPQRLALTAWYFRPDLEVQRRAWHTAQAAEITAGMRPPIGVAGAVERADNSGPFEAPWTVTLGLVFRIELGGKRGARIAAAQARALAAELQARVIAWQIASDVRTAHSPWCRETRASPAGPGESSRASRWPTRWPVCTRPTPLVSPRLTSPRPR